MDWSALIAEIRKFLETIVTSAFNMANVAESEFTKRVFYGYQTVIEKSGQNNDVRKQMIYTDYVYYALFVIIFIVTLLVYAKKKPS